MNGDDMVNEGAPVNDLSLNDPDSYDFNVSHVDQCACCQQSGIQIDNLNDQIVGHEQDYDGTRFENHELRMLLQTIADWVATDTNVGVPGDVTRELFRMGFLP